MKRSKLWLKILHSFWFLPALYIIAAIILALVTVHIDFTFTEKEWKTIVPDVLVPDAELSAKLLSSLTTATLTMTTISFSTIMVVLTTFSGQFSPRTLQNFVSDRAAQNILAIFISGFIYDLVAFLQLKTPGEESLFVTPTLAVFIAVLGAAAFIYFINLVAKLVQVNHLINRLTTDAIKTINNLDHDIKRFQQHPAQTEPLPFDEKSTKENTITAKQAGYIDIIDFSTLMKYIQSDNITVWLNVYLGDYVVTGMQLLSYSQDPEQPVSNIEKYRSCIKVSWERTGVQDIEFEIQKLVEIALRAISPSTNDPNTAINCINRIGEIFIYLGNKKWLHPELIDNQKQERLTIKQHDFSYYLHKAFFQIRHYAKEDVSVTTAILNACKLIAGQTPANVHETIWEFANYIVDGFNKEVLLPQDENFLNHEFNRIAEITGHDANSKHENS